MNRQTLINELAVVFAFFGFIIGIAITSSPECGVIAGSATGIATIVIGIVFSGRGN